MDDFVNNHIILLNIFGVVSYPKESSCMDEFESIMFDITLEFGPIHLYELLYRYADSGEIQKAPLNEIHTLKSLLSKNLLCVVNTSFVDITTKGLLLYGK
jgi:hypothetical protein